MTEIIIEFEKEKLVYTHQDNVDKESATALCQIFIEVLALTEFVDTKYSINYTKP